MDPCRNLTDQGLQFTADQEGFVSVAYVCPGGALTIGHGLTMGSRVFAEYWRAKHGRGLKRGDTIGFDESLELMRRCFVDEYAPPVTRAIATRIAHEFDAAGDTTFNCGPGAVKWRWAKALAAGDATEAARLLRQTATTANGRRLPGLVRRRAAAAEIMVDGRYPEPHERPSASERAEDVRQFQGWLAALGYRVGPVDGIAGRRTVAIVKRFQLEHGLKVDGVVGPATRATLIRALDRKRQDQGAAGGGALAGGGTATQVDPGAIADPGSILDTIVTVVSLGVGIAAIVGLTFFAWRYRSLITGRRVPT